jgi:glyoxylase-like metal-dependent hydrolase (beta-lactamase superfamily II)
MSEIAWQQITDGAAHYVPESLASNASSDAIRAALKDRIDAQGLFLVPYGPQLVRAGGHVILIDAGLGDLAYAIGEPAGRLQDSLRQAAVRPEDISIVLITHCHPDHIGGLTTMKGGVRTPVFENARHIVWESEWQFWTSDSSLAQLPDMLAAPAREHLPALANRDVIEIIKVETEVAPGVRITPAPGHTPGHFVVHLSLPDQHVVLSADALLDVTNFEHPDWYSPVDAIPELAISTRRRLLDEVARDRSIFVGYHLGPAGRVERVGTRFRLDPVPATTSSSRVSDHY